MNRLKGLCSLIVLAGLVILLPGTTLADPAKESFCSGIKDMDKLNWCRAFEIDKAKTEEQKKNRYQNKNHTTYYCSLIKSRDLQTYCFALAGNKKSSCGLIIDAKMEKECNENIK